MSIDEPEDFNTRLELIKNNTCTPLKISIFTLCLEFNKKINLKNFFHNFSDDDSCVKWSKFIIKPKQDSTKSFGNCTIVDFLHIDQVGLTSNISAKIFCNGKVQVAGCKTIWAVHEVPEIIKNFIINCSPNSIEKFNNDLENDSDKLLIINRKISMINSNFKIKNINTIDQQKLKDIINENHRYDGKKGKWRTAIYQPGKYHGVNIKYWLPSTRLKYKQHIELGKKIPKKVDGQITIFVFRSGSITISGAKNISDLESAYSEITNLINNYKDELIY